MPSLFSKLTVLDVSGSMYAFEKFLKSVLSEQIANNPDKRVYCFNHELVEGTPATNPSGLTDIRNPFGIIKESLRQSTTHELHVNLLTDGMHNVTSIVDLLKSIHTTLKEAREKGITITFYVVMLGSYIEYDCWVLSLCTFCAIFGHSLNVFRYSGPDTSEISLRTLFREKKFINWNTTYAHVFGLEQSFRWCKNAPEIMECLKTYMSSFSTSVQSYDVENPLDTLMDEESLKEEDVSKFIDFFVTSIPPSQKTLVTSIMNLRCLTIDSILDNDLVEKKTCLVNQPTAPIPEWCRFEKNTLKKIYALSRIHTVLYNILVKWCFQPRFGYILDQNGQFQEVDLLTCILDKILVIPIMESQDNVDEYNALMSAYLSTMNVELNSKEVSKVLYLFGKMVSNTNLSLEEKLVLLKKLFIDMKHYFLHSSIRSYLETVTYNIHYDYRNKHDKTLQQKSEFSKTQVKYYGTLWLFVIVFFYNKEVKHYVYDYRKHIQTTLEAVFDMIMRFEIGGCEGVAMYDYLHWKVIPKEMLFYIANSVIYMKEVTRDNVETPENIRKIFFLLFHNKLGNLSEHPSIKGTAWSQLFKVIHDRCYEYSFENEYVQKIFGLSDNCFAIMNAINSIDSDYQLSNTKFGGFKPAKWALNSVPGESTVGAEWFKRFSEHYDAESLRKEYKQLHCRAPICSECKTNCPMCGIPLFIGLFYSTTRTLHTKHESNAIGFLVPNNLLTVQKGKSLYETIISRIENGDFADYKEFIKQFTPNGILHEWVHFSKTVNIRDVYKYRSDSKSMSILSNNFIYIRDETSERIYSRTDPKMLYNILSTVQSDILASIRRDYNEIYLEVELTFFDNLYNFFRFR